MKPFMKRSIVTVIVLVGIIVAYSFSAIHRGFSTRDKPSAVVQVTIRAFAVSDGTSWQLTLSTVQSTNSNCPSAECESNVAG